LAFNGPQGSPPPAAVHKSSASSTTIPKADYEQARERKPPVFMIMRHFAAAATGFAQKTGRVRASFRELSVVCCHVGRRCYGALAIVTYTREAQC